MEFKDEYKQKMEVRVKEFGGHNNLMQAKIESSGTDVKFNRGDEFKGLSGMHGAASLSAKIYNSRLRG